MKNDVYTDKLLQIKTDIQRWLGISAEDSSNNEVDQAQRKAEQFIWKLQERYGYIRVRQDRDQ